jgi:hydrogenase nickel incorporation protein HypA/HybF
MHELSIALSLVDAACEKAAELGGVRVDVLHVRIGALAGVMREALEFSFDLAAQGSAIEGAKLMIEDVPITVWCPACCENRLLVSIQHFQCPVCETPTPQVVGGRELELATLEVTDLCSPESSTSAKES